MMESKIAFFTIDAESFKHTECVHKMHAKENPDMLDGLDEYLSLLEKHGIRATLFFMLETALKIKDKVEGYIKRGHKIAVHGLKHKPCVDMPYQEFFDGVKQCKEELENTFGQKIIGFRAPFFSLKDEHLNALKELGFLYDASKSGCIVADHSGSVDVTDYERLYDGVYRKDGFYEFALVCKKFFGVEIPISGGGYVRCLPWFTIKNLIKRNIKKSDYYVFYLHPFELSKEKVPKYKRMKFSKRNYLVVGRKSYAKKIESIIKTLKKCGYTFATMEDFVLNGK